MHSLSTLSRRLRGLTPLLALATYGCFLDRSAIGGEALVRDDGGPTARDDGGRGDGGTAADAGARDGGVDAGPPCVERCDGERALTCDRGVIDCAAMEGYCALEASRPVCRPRVCAPATTRCSEDRASVVTCDARGTAVVASTECARGCLDDACRPETPCPLAVASTVSAGTSVLDLCGGGNDDEHTDGSACFAPLTMSGQDRLVRLEVSRPGRYRLELRDVRDALPVDPVLYIRSQCDSDAVLACDNNGGDLLNARLELDLPAGDHFLILDSYDYSAVGFSTGCGPVELHVTRLGS